MTREINLHSGYVAVVDDDDYGTLVSIAWHIIKSGKSMLYAAHSINLGNGKWKSVYMHRMILTPPEGMFIDHIDRNGLNNTRSNLRIATMHQNLGNSRRRSDNTSGYRGVSKRKNGGRKWEATIFVNGKNVRLGMFDDIEDAARAYDKAATGVFREFANTNFPPDQTTKELLEALR